MLELFDSFFPLVSIYITACSGNPGTVVTVYYKIMCLWSKYRHLNLSCTYVEWVWHYFVCVLVKSVISSSKQVGIRSVLGLLFGVNLRKRQTKATNSGRSGARFKNTAQKDRFWVRLYRCAGGRSRSLDWFCKVEKERRKIQKGLKHQVWEEGKSILGYAVNMMWSKTEGVQIPKR